VPYWQEAGFNTGIERPWLEGATALVSQSLARLDEAVDMCRYLFDADLPHSDAAKEQLNQAGTAAVLQTTLDALKTEPLTTQDEAKAIIKQVTKAADVKKGLVMRSLRAALTCDMKGPDLVDSWLLLHQRGIDTQRLETALGLTE
ncbi:MAG: glutamate--tRNA ligase, partial [Cyanobacteria bacterium P01_A01_bin.135]